MLACHGIWDLTHKWITTEMLYGEPVGIYLTIKVLLVSLKMAPKSSKIPRFGTGFFSGSWMSFSVPVFWRVPGTRCFLFPQCFLFLLMVMTITVVVLAVVVGWWCWCLFIGGDGSNSGGAGGGDDHFAGDGDLFRYSFSCVRSTAHYCAHRRMRSKAERACGKQFLSQSCSWMIAEGCAHATQALQAEMIINHSSW